MKNNRPIALLTMAGILLPTVACNSRDVLLVVRDAAADQPAQLDAANPGAGGASGIAGTGGSGGAVASSGADASASAGGSADVAVSGTTDSGSALGTPKGFRIVNATTHTVYVDLGHPVKCRAQDASGWQACEFFGLWCLLDCQFFQPGDQCCEQCDAGEPSLLAVPAGGSRTIAWTGSLFAARAGYCSGCECQEQSAVGQGTYEATVRAYDQYACVGGQPCPEQPDGTIRDAVPQGSYQEPAVQFAIPSADEMVVITIPEMPHPLDASDSGVQPDRFVAPPNPLDALDAPALVDVGSARDEGGVEDIPGAEDAASCQPLAYSVTNLSSGHPYDYCPVDPALPECKSSDVGDVGATVYRDEGCALATLQAHPDCSPWQRDLRTEYVFIIDPFGGCEWPITVDSVLDCGDHVSIAYSVVSPCSTCDAIIPSAVMITIPNDPKSVRAIATLEYEMCR